ncbi:MAG: protein phosphatase 2C domain-containing protein, partial [Bradymonadaceae bacterium]
MKDEKAACPKCGRLFTPPGACPNCGTTVDLDLSPGSETGDRRVFNVDPGRLGVDGDESVEIEVELRRNWEASATRSVFAAAPVRIDGEAPEDLGERTASVAERAFLVEEIEHGGIGEPLESDDRGQLADRLRHPIATTEVEGATLQLYLNQVGISVEKLLELAPDGLPAPTVVSLFRGLLDTVSSLHGAGRLHLRLAPSEIWCRHPDFDYGIPPAWLWGRGEAPATEPGPLDGPSSASDPGETVDMVTEGASVSARRWLEALGARGPAGDSSNGLKETGDVQLTPGAEGIEVEHPDWTHTQPTEIAIDGSLNFPDIDSDRPKSRWIEGYAAPESAQSGEATPSAASDVFSLGMILYALVAARPPPTSVYTRQTAVIPARNFRPSFPPGLAPVIARATRPEPDMRYPDVSSLETAFEESVDAMIDRTHASGEPAPSIDLAVDRHVGIGKREANPVNQDDVCGHATPDGRLALMSVADGVSTASYGSGDIASEMLIESSNAYWDDLIETYDQGEPFDPLEIVREILDDANEKIVEYVSERHTPFEGNPHEVMGTTGLVALYRDGQVTLGSIGDSRAYLQRGPGLEQMTVDHNLWTLSVLEGVPADDALSMPRSNALARCLGTFLLEDDELVPTEPEVDIVQFDVASGDRLLLTTDGLIDFAGGSMLAAEENILSTRLSEPDPALACLE